MTRNLKAMEGMGLKGSAGRIGILILGYLRMLLPLKCFCIIE
jgi:hypothetical protein